MLLRCERLEPPSLSWVHSRRSDGQQGFAECPLCLQWRPSSVRRNEPTRSAITRHRPDYSMIASARAISAGGTDSPIALAVLRSSTSSNFVGWRNGRSPGLAPLRMRPT